MEPLGSGNSELEFQLESELLPGSQDALWSARRRVDGTRVLLQVPTNDAEFKSTIGRYCHELEVLQTLQSSATLAAGTMVSGDRPALVYHDEGPCESLEARIQREPIQDLQEFFSIAICLAEAVGEFHQRGVVHSRLATKKILLTERRSCLVTDFSNASRFPECAAIDLGRASHEEHALAHMSPEQTGRLNRRIDYRTDIYSLGVIYFRMLTGQHPLEADDIIGWVHAHIALPPNSVLALRPSLPKLLDQLLSTLLAKNPESRYQSALRVAEDLRALSKGETPDIVVGSTQASGHFRLSTRIYGREEETAVLNAAFERAATGTNELVFMSGYSGVGKTALVHETHRPLVAKRGLYCSGKFGQFGRSTPHSAIMRAIVDLVDLIADLLSGVPGALDSLALGLVEELGTNLAIVTERIPALEVLVGKQPTPLPLDSADAQIRFHLSIIQLLSCIATAQRPVVIFLDDLQWSDLPSLRLLEEIQSTESLKHLLLVGAYRDNEVDASHPLKLMQDRLAMARDLQIIELKPLARDDLASLIVDSFSWDSQTALKLAGIVMDKTGGSPFFALQFLRSLYDDEILTFDFAKSEWVCDCHEVSDRDLSENVVELMAQRIKHFDIEAQNLLGLASCLGSEFDLLTLAAAAGVPAYEEHQRLYPFLSIGFLKSVGAGHQWMELGHRGEDLVNQNARHIIYRFAHDRMQQAAHSLIPPGDLPKHHLRLATVVAKLDTKPGAAYRVAGHYNEALGIIEDAELLLTVAQVNLEAATRAEESGAHENMRVHAWTAAETLGRRANDDDRQLLLQAYRALGMAHMYLGHVAEADDAYEKAFTCCSSVIERVSINTLSMEMHVAMGGVQTALAFLVSMLGELGVELDTDNVAEVAAAAPAAILAARDGRTDAEIVGMPAMEDVHDIALVTLVGKAIDTAFMNGREWVIAITSTAICRCLRKGILAPASICFSTYGVVDAEPDGPQGYRTRYQYGRIGRLIADRYGEPMWISAANVSNIHHYGLPFREASARFDNAADVGWNSSSLTWAAYGRVRSLFMCLTAGQDLERIALAAANGATRARQSNRLVAATCCESLGALIKGLQSNAPDAWMLGGTDGAAELAEKVSMMGPWSACKYYAEKQFLAVVWGRYDTAREATDAMRPISYALLGMCHEPLYYICEAIVLAHEEATANTERLGQLITYFGDHADLNGDYLPCKLLVQGLLAMVQEQYGDATEFLQDAAELANTLEQRHFEAIAYEHAGFIAARKQRPKLERFYLKLAASAYLRWGATGKAAAIRHALTRTPRSESLRPRRAQTESSAPSEPLTLPDVESLFKACQAISSQIRIDDLLRTQIQIAAENLGAQRGMIVLRADRGLVVEVECTLEHGSFKTTRAQNILKLSDPRYPLISHVLRTGITKIVDEVTDDEDFGVSAIPSAPASILCSPITSMGAVVGVLYLENNDLHHAFAPSSAARRVLLTQISSSLENSRLYENLSSEIDQRKDAQEVIRAERDYLQQINELTPLIVCCVAPNGLITFVNKTVETITGFKSKGLVGTNWAKTFFAGRQEEDSADLLRSLVEAGDQSTNESILVDSEGKEHTLSWTLVDHYHAQGRLIEVVCFGTDLTDARRVEQERVEMQVRLLEAQRIETVGTLAASVAHDFNNVLVPIMASGSILQRMDVSDRVKQIAYDILQASDRGAALASQLLVVARQSPSERTSVRLQDILREVMRLVRASLPATIELKIDVDDDCPHILGDSNQLHQVILNLCTNAGHAMRSTPGGVLEMTLTVPQDWSEQKHDLGETAGVPCLRLSVKDNGHGMTQSVLEKVLDPFFTTKDAGEGTGLGLWGVNKIIETHEARLGVNSTKGDGTEFVITFPISADETTKTNPDDDDDDEIQGGDEKILLVDDEEQTLRIIGDILADLGYEVTRYLASTDALSAFETDPDFFDILVTDYTMPQLTGTDLAEAVQRKRPSFPVVIVSGLAAMITENELARAEISEVLSKPQTASGYAKAIRRSLAKTVLQ